MAEPLPGRLAENVVHFARALRAAGVNVGPAQVAGALAAVQAAGFGPRADLYHALRSTLICRAEHLQVFDQLFALFWRDPDILNRLIQLMSPAVRTAPEKKPPAARRAEEALGGARPPPETPPPEPKDELVARLAWSGEERLRTLDFEQMSAAELAEAARAVRSLVLPVKPLLTRRATPSPHGPRPDLRATLRRALRRGGEIDRIARRAPRRRPPDLVVLTDISGSMSVYSRILMHWLHALTWAPERGWGAVHAFTFGTRLTNVTRALARSDPDTALAAAGREARDWQGGTRIGAALHAFNRDWSRRVLARGAVVILITDGLERGDASLLAAEAERLRLSSRRLLWLNPLLRWQGFQPKAAGIRALLPHVDSLHACHSLDSLAALSAAFARAEPVKTIALRRGPDSLTAGERSL